MIAKERDWERKRNFWEIKTLWTARHLEEYRDEVLRKLADLTP
ncbi:MAG: hypothetical protein NWE91_00260 [Candidatus Bathyarchaeota archaeon]|nr:hypothetical protein [Candidatus Bathyarchaeota archaeon]